ncbi:hypothetical protein LCGC14_1703950 [marine sediment metagenome]|uniref:Uncharacterized protein n=1 Tax=marine sediment metagenome TaxID=412755 RepID=A0A0F9I4P8_9ZZZZ
MKRIHDVTMESITISDERKRKFLERCGFQCYWQATVDSDIEAWICPPDSERTIAFYGFTLDFLFKYAVPDDCTIQFQQHDDTLDCVIYFGREWYSGQAGRKEYGTSLFLALEEAFDNL